MPLIMTKDGRGEAMKAPFPSWREVTERDERIRRLESRCVELTAEIDRQRPVVQAARQWHSLSKYRPEHYLDYEQDLAVAVAAYEAVKEQG